MKILLRLFPYHPGDYFIESKSFKKSVFSK